MDVADRNEVVPTPPQDELHSPVRDFQGSHGYIVEGLHGLGKLPELAAALEHARHVAHATLTLFDKVVREHHADEEQELFVHVQKSCGTAAEEEHVRTLVRQLVAEHREIEKLWHRLRPAVAATAQGKPHEMPDFGAEVAKLVELYLGHARLEEEEFLPLADGILGRNANHLAALDIALHLRHAPLPKSAYV